MKTSLLNYRQFFSLFNLQILNVINDNVLKNATMVLVVYQGLSIFHLKSSITINIITFVFILPLFLFASYAGKVADYYSKVHIIRIIKVFEIVITTIAIFGLAKYDIWLLILGIILLSTHSAFFTPIKYSILPQYFSDRKQLLIANSLIEVGSFVAVLIGQFIGSWFTGNHQPHIIMRILAISTTIGLILSFLMKEMPAIRTKSSYSLNFVLDNYRLYKSVVTNRKIKITMHSIGWFWALGSIYTTQIATLTLHYLGGSAQVFSILIAELSIAIGIGSFICTLISRGEIKKKFVIIGTIGISICTFILLCLDPHLTLHATNLKEFSSNIHGKLVFVLIFLIGTFAGFYSITCYNELQVISPLENFSQIIAVNNMINATYVLFAIGIAIAVLFFTNSWFIFALTSVTNLLFTYVYYRLEIKQNNAK